MADSRVRVEVIGSSVSFQRAMAQAGAAAAKFDHQTRKLAADSERLHSRIGGHVKRLAGAALSLGGLGVGFFGVEGIEKSIEAATEAAAIQRQLRRQLVASGLSWNDYGDQIEQATLKLSGISGYTATQLEQSFTTIVRATQNVGQALRINSIAADVARGRHISLTTASVALSKAYYGQTTALKRLGILVPKNLKGMAALEFVAGKFAGQAKAGATAQDRFGASLHNSEVIIGTALLPTITRLLNHAAAYLTRLNSTGALQRKVNSVMRVAGQVAHALGDAFRVIRAIVVPLNHALGGTRNSVRVLIGAFVAFKALKMASTVAGLAGSFGRLGARERGAAAGSRLLTASFIGKAGLVVGAGLAAFAITSLFLKVTGLDKKLRSAGGAAFDLAASLGLVNDPTAQFKGKLVPGQASTQFLRNRAARLEARGLTPEQAAARLVATHPKLAKHDAEVIAGVYGSKPVVHHHHHTTVHVHSSDPKKVVAELQKHAKRKAAQTRGNHGGHNLALT